jgi:thiol-disulfide isomerase/thioredoxin
MWLKLEMSIGVGCVALISCVDTDSGKADAHVTPADAGTDNSAVEDTGLTPCVYPSGPYGTSIDGSWVGMTVPPTFTWQGYLKGSSLVQTLSAQDLYDCDGRFNINAIVFDLCAVWCGGCQAEAQQLPTWMQTWGPIGVVFVTLMVQDVSQNKATTAAALAWRDQFNLGNVSDVVADPNFSFAHSGTNAFPMNLLVDPRTMKVIAENTGQLDPAVTDLANKNK